MMNKGLMQRQMFARGGAAGFPDLTGDGKVTQADILKGRGVEMQMGGEPMAAQQLAMQGAPAPAEAAGMSMGQAAAEAQQMGIDPGMMQQFITQMGEGYGNLDNAESNEEVMNMLRGDNATLEERYAELADMVGEEDAAQTPESVLTLVQPVMMMAEVDQGIGGLAQDQMQAPIEGDMAGGIMSTVGMGQEGPASGNFNQGGQPVAMSEGGNSRLEQLYQQQRDVYRSLIDPAQSQQAYEDQKRLTESQMLFDLAQAGLQFAGTTEGRTIGERLANAAAQSQLFPKIGQRAQGLQDLKTQQRAEERSMDLAALQAASGLYSTEEAARLNAEAAAAARMDKDIGDIYDITITDKDGNVTSSTRGPMSVGEYKELSKKHGKNLTVTLVPKTTSTTVQKAENFQTPDGVQPAIPGTLKYNNFVKQGYPRVSALSSAETAPKSAENFIFEGQVVSAVPGTEEYNQMVSKGAVRTGTLDASIMIDTEQVTLTKDVTVGGTTYKAGTSPNFTKLQIAALAPDSYTAFQAPVTDRDIFQKFGVTKDQWNGLQEEDRAYLVGLPTVTSKDYFTKFGMEKDAFLALPETTRMKMVGLGPDTQFFNVDGAIVGVDKDTKAASVVHTSDKLELRTVDGVLVGFDPKTEKVTELFKPGADPIKPEYRIVIRGGIETVVDINTTEGQAAVALANADNQAAGATVATVRTMPAESKPTAKAFAIPGVGTVLSYDNGRTYTKDGKVSTIPTGATPLSDTIAYDVAKNERIMAAAGNQLKKLDEMLLGTSIKGGDADNPTALSSKEAGLVRDAMEAAREGTGPYAGLAVFLDRTVGGFIPQARTAFQDTQANRQFLRGLVILGRSALVVNPRFPVAEMERVGELFPNPDTFFGNPETEANKLVELRNLALAQKRANLEQLASGIQDKATLQAVMSNNFEIDRLLGLLPETTRVDSTNTEAINSLRNTLNLNRKPQNSQ